MPNKTTSNQSTEKWKRNKLTGGKGTFTEAERKKSTGVMEELRDAR